MLKHDEIEKSEEYMKVIDKVEKEVEERLNRQGISKGLGYIHLFEGYKKEILKEKYNIDWKTTQEMNSDVILD